MPGISGSSSRSIRSIASLMMSAAVPWIGAFAVAMRSAASRITRLRLRISGR